MNTIPSEPLNVPLAIAPHAAVAFARRADALMAGALLPGGTIVRAPDSFGAASRRADDGEEVETEGGTYELRNGVGIVSIVGPLGQYGGWWFDGHCSVQARLMRAISDPRASAIMIEINSPGGTVAGCFDAVRAVRGTARESGKRVLVFAADAAYSAAFAWACVGDEIHLPDSGGVGSIGVLSMMISWARMNEETGIDVAVIRSGTQKADGWPDLPLDPNAIAREQVEVDRLARIFAQIVSESRGVAIDKLLELQGATVHGANAVAVGLADSVTTFEAVLAKAEQAGRQRQMQTIAARLGLATSASEADINAAITKLEVDGATKLAQAQASLAAEAKKVEALAVCAVDLAVRSGVITTGQRDTKLEMMKAMPEAVARELAAAAPAFPGPRAPSAEGPQTGDAYKTKKGAPSEFPADTQAQLALYEKDPDLYHQLRNARDAKKGVR